MEKTKVDTILISDIHLGTDYCHAEELLEMLSEYHFKKLILVGDVFQHGNFDRIHNIAGLHKSHWKVLSLLRQLSDPATGIEVIWIEGNHDWKVLNIIGALIGVQVYDEYIWESAGKKFMAIHGHQFDIHLPKGELLNRLGQNIYMFFQRHFHKTTTRIASKFSRFSRSVEFVRDGALAYAGARDCDFVFCGHTHRPEDISRMHGKKNIRYINCGTWANGPKLSYIILTGTEAKLMDFPYKYDWREALKKKQIYSRKRKTAGVA